MPGESFSASYVQSWTSLLPHLMGRFNLRLLFGYHSDVYAMRNWMTDRILEDPTDFVLWIDDDNLVTPQAFDELWRVATEPGAPSVVAGWCWVYDQGKQEYWLSCGEIDDGGKCRPADPRKFDDREPYQVAYTGFPVVLHRASLLHSGIFSHYFPYQGEDVAFCRRISEKGLTIGIATKVLVPHLKTVAVQPNMLDLKEK